MLRYKLHRALGSPGLCAAETASLLLLLCFCHKKDRDPQHWRGEICEAQILMKMYQYVSSQFPKGARGNYKFTGKLRKWTPKTLCATTYQHAQRPFQLHRGAQAPQSTKQMVFVGEVMWGVKFLTLITLTGIPQMEKLKGRTGQDLPRSVPYNYSKLF